MIPRDFVNGEKRTVNESLQHFLAPCLFSLSSTAGTIEAISFPPQQPMMLVAKEARYKFTTCEISLVSIDDSTGVQNQLSQNSVPSSALVPAPATSR